MKATDAVRGKPFTSDHKTKIRNALLNLSPEAKALKTKQTLETKVKSILQLLIDNNLELTEENYNLYKTNGYPKITTVFDSMDAAVKYFKLNHKVKNIEYIHVTDPVPVYDLTVDNYNNFLVDAGVVLHNCYRFGYYATVNKFNEGEPQLIPSKQTNPDDELGSACKHVLLVLSNTSWLIKVASVIKNYIEYMKRNRQQQYANIIYPAIYGKKYEEPTQLSIDDDTLQSDEQTLDISNIEARKKGQFKPGNIYRIPPKQTIKDQIDIEDEESISEE